MIPEHNEEDGRQFDRMHRQNKIVALILIGVTVVVVAGLIVVGYFLFRR